MFSYSRCVWLLISSYYLLPVVSAQDILNNSLLDTVVDPVVSAAQDIVVTAINTVESAQDILNSSLLDTVVDSVVSAVQDIVVTAVKTVESPQDILEPPLLDTAVNPFVYLDSGNFTYENHTITTEDGYILLTVRIISGNSSTKPPVLFVHGIWSLFYDFLNGGPSNSIGFAVLAEGYDVWLANTRGSTYGREHVTLDPNTDAAFWNFSWHEAGIYDIPANIDYITNLTGYSEVSYVGHSQGTTIFLAMAATKPEYNEKITFSLLLAPVAFLQYAQSPGILLLKDNLVLWNALVELLQLRDVLAYSPVTTALTHLLCNNDAPTIFICDIILDLLAGPTTQRNESMDSVIFTNEPAGSSAKEMTHFLQNANSGEFRLFDYGTNGNQILYNQTTPPSYNLSAVTAPVALIYGQNDFFCDTTDALRLASDLPNLVQNYIIPYVETDHVDVLWGTQVQSLVNQFAIGLINQYNGQ